MKKILLTLTLFLFCSAASAEEITFDDSPTYSAPKKVAIFVVLPGYGVAKPDEVRESIHENIASKLEKDGFIVIPQEKSRTIARTYARENLAGPVYYGIESPITFKKEDISAITKESGADIGVLVQAAVTDTKIKAGFMKVSTQQTVTCELRILDIETNSYVADTTYSADGKSSAGPYGGMPSSDRAFMRAVDGALEKIVLPDFSK